MKRAPPRAAPGLAPECIFVKPCPTGAKLNPGNFITSTATRPAKRSTSQRPPTTAAALLTKRLETRRWEELHDVGVFADAAFPPIGAVRLNREGVLAIALVNPRPIPRIVF